MQLEISDAVLVLGRVLLGGLFVYGGIRHFFILPMLVPVVTARGVPFPRLALIAASAFQAIAGLSLMFGVFVVPAALGLVLFTLVASVTMLNFWDMTGPERETLKGFWMSNVAIIGGLLIAASQAL